MKKLGLFEGFGIELEYMIVDKSSMQIRTISDEILFESAGEGASDFKDGDITWSNELVLHVIELKTSAPVSSLLGLESSFHKSLNKVNCLLEKHNAHLLPTAMHPFMKPTEMKLWPHDNNEVYKSYDRIFSCQGHGWCNLQSMHINLPFNGSEEFERLHTAIRFLLPLLPALAASSPVVEGKRTPTKDNRLIYYQLNQARIPSISGRVIPEPVTSIDDYHHSILSKIYADIAPHDDAQILREDWLNSRGAIARFERQSIEIRVLDLQETPSMDIAIADFIVGMLRYLVFLPKNERNAQRNLSTDLLKAIFDASTSLGESAEINSQEYLDCWSAPKNLKTTNDLLKFIFSNQEVRSHIGKNHESSIEILLNAGTLATRIQRSLGEFPTQDKITQTYKSLASCLKNDKFFQS